MSRRDGEPKNSCPIFDDALKLLGKRDSTAWGARQWHMPSPFADSIAAHIASEWNDFAREMEDRIESARTINAKLREWSHVENAAREAEIAARDETIRELEARIEELERENEKLEDRLSEEP